MYPRQVPALTVLCTCACAKLVSWNLCLYKHDLLDLEVALDLISLLTNLDLRLWLSSGQINSAYLIITSSITRCRCRSVCVKVYVFVGEGVSACVRMCKKYGNNKEYELRCYVGEVPNILFGRTLDILLKFSRHPLSIAFINFEALIQT